MEEYQILLHQYNSENDQILNNLQQVIDIHPNLSDSFQLALKKVGLYPSTPDIEHQNQISLTVTGLDNQQEEKEKEGEEAKEQEQEEEK